MDRRWRRRTASGPGSAAAYLALERPREACPPSTGHARPNGVVCRVADTLVGGQHYSSMMWSAGKLPDYDFLLLRGVDLQGGTNPVSR